MEDRRARKTKQALREGLAELLYEKKLQKITVKELVEKADIHRSTFYVNFHDIYDLYQHIEDVAIEEIKVIFQADYGLDDFYRAILKYVSENKKTSGLFFNKIADNSFVDRLVELHLDSCIMNLHKEYGINITDEKLKPYMFPYITYCFSGSIAVIGKWIMGELPHSSEEIVEMLCGIDVKVGKQVVNML